MAISLPNRDDRLSASAGWSSLLTNRRRTTKKQKGHGGVLALVLLVAIFGGIAFLVSSPMPPHSRVQPSVPSASQGSQSVSTEDAFFGSIVNAQSTGNAIGIVKADTNCKPVEHGLTNCIAIITGSDGAELHFNYSHDMSNQSCLATGDHVTIELLGDGNVKVIRG